MHYTPPLAYFGTPKAKIDFITIDLPSRIRTRAEAANLMSSIKGRICVSNRWRDYQDDWITIHDPTTSDLQWLLDNYPEAGMLCIEIAVDFQLSDKSDKSNPERLADLHRWLKVRLFPQRHKQMQLVGKRKYYDARTGKIEPDTLKTKSGDESVYWKNKSDCEQVRLYIKTFDNGKPVDKDGKPVDKDDEPVPHVVRLESTLFRGGCQNIELHRVADLPIFADNLRRELSRYLYAVKGIKPKIKRVRSSDPVKAKRAAHVAALEVAKVQRNWDKLGAAWAAKWDYATIPDTTTNRLIGSALKGLRDDLKTLKLTRKVAKHCGYETAVSPAVTGK
jgi:hypothetical protein